jgi:hypothetical protein
MRGASSRGVRPERSNRAFLSSECDPSLRVIRVDLHAHYTSLTHSPSNEIVLPSGQSGQEVFRGESVADSGGQEQA